MFVSLAAVAANAALNYVLILHLGFGHVGLAVSTSVMATFNLALLVFILQRRKPVLEMRRLVSQVARIFAACIIMGVATTFGYRWFQAAGFDTGTLPAAVEVAVLVPVAVLLYGLACRLLGVATLNDAVNMVVRHLKRRPAGRQG